MGYYRMVVPLRMLKSKGCNEQQPFRRGITLTLQLAIFSDLRLFGNAQHIHVSDLLTPFVLFEAGNEAIYRQAEIEDGALEVYAVVNGERRGGEEYPASYRLGGLDGARQEVDHVGE